MFYPKQVPYLLNNEFKANISYREYRFKELDDYCMCIWTMKSQCYLDKPIYNNILPDACIDIVISFTDKTILFAGYSRETVPLELKGNVDFMGVRMKPGAFYNLFRISADKIMDNPASFSDIEKDFDLHSIFSVADIDEQLKLLKNYLQMKTKTSDNTEFIKMADDLYSSLKEQRVADIANAAGYNQRQLLRIFKQNYGVSPKVLLNILRLHLCLTLMLEENMELAQIALKCGFYDQAHFIKELKRYTGISPLKLLENYKS